MAARLSILIYHRVLAQRDPLFPHEVEQRRFALQMRLLKRWANVLPLTQALGQLRNASLPARAACITFDDGYADNIEQALPVLRSLALPATFFITTGYLDGTTMWNDRAIAMVREASGPSLDLSAVGLGQQAIHTMAQRRSAIEMLLTALKYMPDGERTRRVDALTPRLRGPAVMMDAAQVRMLAASGMEIGAHTVSHPILNRLEPAAARREIGEGKHALERITGAPITLFAYPNGKPEQDFSALHVAMVREAGFLGAVTTTAQVAHPACDPFQLPRFTPWEPDRARFALRLAQSHFSCLP